MNSVYIIWQDKVTRLWHPVSNLSYEDGLYRMFYTKGASASPRFSTFSRMNDFEKEYVSKELFTIFQNRILPENRPEFRKIMSWLDLSVDGFDPLVYMGVSGVPKSTDSLRAVPVPENNNNKYKINFLVSGIRYLDDASLRCVNSMRDGDELVGFCDTENAVDPNAYGLKLKINNVFVGYCPRYLACDLKKVVEGNADKSARFTVKKLNLDAPPQYRLLCSFEADWPSGFTPFNSEEYKPY